MIVKRIDLYILRQELSGFVGTIGIVVLLLSLENVQRLWNFVSGTDSPALLMIHMLTALVPEYIGVGLPVASFLAPALTIRGLARRGEWQVLPATGMSAMRIMRAPMLLACLAAACQLAIRLDVEPWGERALDEITQNIREGDFGLPIAIDEFIPLDDRTALFVAPGTVGSKGETGSVFLRRGSDVFTARRATASRDLDGRIAIDLYDGQQVIRGDTGQRGILTFDQYHVMFSPKKVPRAKQSASDRLDRMGSRELMSRTANNWSTTDGPHPEASALFARISSALFCLMLPWFALVLALPPKRGAGGAGLALGIGVIVLFLRTANVVQTGYLGHPLLAACVHMAVWLAATVALVRYGMTHDDGAIDLAIANAFKRLRALWRKREEPDPDELVAASATAG